VRNRLPTLLRRRRIPWGELARRMLLPTQRLRALRAPDANPRLALAERVADALELPIEAVWALAPRDRRRR